MFFLNEIDLSTLKKVIDFSAFWKFIIFYPSVEAINVIVAPS